MCKRSISCTGSCHGTNQLLVPGGAKQDQGHGTYNKICAGKGCSRERWLHVESDRHQLSKQLLLMFPGNGLSSSELRAWWGEAALFVSDR